MASLGFFAFLLEVSKLKKAEHRIPYFSLGIRKVGFRSAVSRQSSASDDGDEGKEVLSMQKELVQKIAEKREPVSSTKTASMVKQVNSATNSNSNLNKNSPEAKKSKVPSVDAPEKFQIKSKESGSGLPGRKSVVEDCVLKKCKLETKMLTSAAPSNLQASENYRINDEKPESVVEDRELIKKGKLESILPTSAAAPFHLRASENYRTKDGKSEDLIEPDAKCLYIENSVALEKDDSSSSPLAGVNVMNVILVAAECAPWSKTGGLGDVAGALPKALARRGHRVMVIVPRYGDYAEQKDTGVRKRYRVDGQDMEVTYFYAYIDGVDFVFIEHSMFRHCQHNIYGGDRLVILKRMVLFCKAAVEVPWHVPCGGVIYGDGNLVFIANDWHTGLLPVYLKAYYRDHGVMKYARSVLVIHNIAYQGRGPVDDFFQVDLPEHYIDLFKHNEPVGGEHFNIFAAGLKTADRVVTVSHGYAWELKTPEGGWGLHEIINYNDWKFQGIVNGIDTKDWNPMLDVHLKSDGYTNYSLETFKTGKPKCKAALQKELGLPVRPEVPIIGFIGRLDHQKGIDLIAEAMPWIVSQDVQLIMLGTGRPDLEEMLRRFERQQHDKVRGWVGFSIKTAHRITAGADILVMPSRFEPCGLNQLYAMSYATVPVVHAVGGLRDTVIQFDPYNETGLGWAFDRAESWKLIDALGNCLDTYWNYKNSWEGLQTRGMMQDLSWDNAAQIYEEVLVAAKYQW